MSKKAYSRESQSLYQSSWYKTLGKIAYKCNIWTINRNLRQIQNEFHTAKATPEGQPAVYSIITWKFLGFSKYMPKHSHFLWHNII